MKHRSNGKSFGWQSNATRHHTTVYDDNDGGSNGASATANGSDRLRPLASYYSLLSLILFVILDYIS